MNREMVVYVGAKPAVAIDYNRIRFTFKNGKAVSVPDVFAKRLLGSRDFRRADDLVAIQPKKFPNAGIVIFRRWGALGDLLMFRAAVSAFRRAHPAYRVILRCQERFVPIFEEDPLWQGVVATSSALVGDETVGYLNFDQVAEVDHHGVEVHRCDLFLRAMSTQTIKIEPSDWKLPIPPRVSEWVQRHLRTRSILPEMRKRPLVALQIRGSAMLKSLPPDVVSKVVDELKRRECDILIIEAQRDMAERFAGEGVYTMPERDALHVIEALTYVDLAITMDSGALWMAHCAMCPVLAILGPTKAEQRISMHPLIERGLARAIALNEIISCPACFEAAKACNQKYTCMRDQPDWDVVVRMIGNSVTDMLSSNVNLPIV